MPRRKAAAGAAIYSTGCSYDHQKVANVGCSRYTASSGIITESTSAILKALDEPSSSQFLAGTSPKKGKRRVKEVLGIEGGALAETPKPKRTRKTKDPAAPPPEKRAAIFKKKCPQNIAERVERVISQRYGISLSGS